MALDVTVLDENGNEVQMSENIEYGDEDLTPIIEGEKPGQIDESKDFENAGYREADSVESLNDDILDLESFGLDSDDSMDDLGDL